MGQIKHIGFLVHNNQYDSKRDFTRCLREALERQGVTSFLVDTAHGELEPHDFERIRQEKPDLLMTFSQIVPSLDGGFICDTLEIPHLSILLDPVVNSLKLTGSPYSLISCVDRDDCAFLRQSGFEQSFFLPHAVDRARVEPELGPRPYPISFIGSCYDPQAQRSLWDDQYPAEICEVMDEVAERLLSEGDSSLVQTLFTVWAEQGLAAKEFDLAQLCFDIDYYVRALDRMTLITAFPEHEVHVFGETQWATAPGARSWSELLQDYSNIVVHPAVSYAQSFDILRQTKICLNSSPFFRDGTHERVFAGMACGCAVLTSRSRYLEEQFFEEEELLFYDFDLLEIAEARVEELLADERRRVILAHRGAQKVYHDHTWDQRAETLLEELPGMLDRLSVDPRT
jgi:hypothetical protein